MKKLILVLIFCLATIATKAQGGDVKGAWTGKLNVYGTELTLVFHLDSVNCTLDSPDQGIKGVPAKLEHTATGIKVTIAPVAARFSGIRRLSCRII